MALHRGSIEIGNATEIRVVREARDIITVAFRLDDGNSAVISLNPANAQQLARELLRKATEQIPDREEVERAFNESRRNADGF